MATKITLRADGSLERPRRPDHPLRRGRRHRRRHLARRADRDGRGRGEARQADRLDGGARRAEGVRRDRLVAPGRDRRRVPRVPDRHQGPAHHAGRRRHPLAQRRAAPAHRPLRVPAPGAVVPGRAVAGEASRARRHGDLPREHRGHLRRARGRRGNARSEEAHRARSRRTSAGTSARTPASASSRCRRPDRSA